MTAKTARIIPAAQFAKLVKTHRLRGEKTLHALELVMCSGWSFADAAREAGIDRSAVTRALAVVSRPVCAKCGQPLERN